MSVLCLFSSISLVIAIFVTIITTAEVHYFLILIILLNKTSQEDSKVGDKTTISSGKIVTKTRKKVLQPQNYCL